MNDHEAMLAIQRELSGEEWSSDTLDAIGNIMIRAGYHIESSLSGDDDDNWFSHCPDQF